MKRLFSILLLSVMCACTQTTNTPPVNTQTQVQSTDLTPLVDSPQVGKIVIAFMQKYPSAPYSQAARTELTNSLTNYFNDAKKDGVITDFRIQMDNTVTDKIVVYIYLSDFAGFHAFARSIP